MKDLGGSSSSGWTANGNRGGPGNNNRHHLPHQYGGSPASMMLNSYCTMTNSKSRPFYVFFLSKPSQRCLTNRLQIIDPHVLSILFVGGLDKEKKRGWMACIKKKKEMVLFDGTKRKTYCIQFVYRCGIPEVLSTHTPRRKKKRAKHKEVLCVVESRGEPRREQGKPQKYIRIH